MRDNIRRSMPLFPIGTVMQLTELTARQIRYYEEHRLITPARTDGNRRLFSFSDVDRLLEIKDMLEQGINLAGIKKLIVVKDATKENQYNVSKQQISNTQLRNILRAEILQAGRLNNTTLRQGDMSRFFH